LLPVRECGGFAEKKRQTLSRREEIGWGLTPKGSKRSAGFAPTSDLRKEESTVELILDDEE
jgi:hypothetical protein